MKTSKILMLMAVGVAMVATGRADARNLPATSGHPVPYSAWFTGGTDAWTQSSGAVFNKNDGVTRHWEMDLPIDSSSFNAAVTVITSSMAGGPAGVYVTCTAFGVTQSGLSYWSGTSPSASTSYATLVSSGAYIPAGGMLYVNCEVPPGKSLASVQWYGI